MTTSIMKTNKRIKKAIYTTLAILFWIALWHIVARRINLTLILPTPSDTLKVIFSLAGEGEFWQICLSSVRTIFLGALSGIVLGALVAVISYFSEPLKYLFSPLMSLVKATPIVSFIILFLIWIGRDKIPFYISLMMVVPIVSSNILKGLESIDRDLVEAIRVYRLPFSKAFKLLYRHSLMPYILSALQSAVALSWKAGIASEVLCSPAGTLGTMLSESQIYLETPTLFAYTVVTVVISVILEKIVVTISSHTMGGKDDDRA